MALSAFTGSSTEVSLVAPSQIDSSVVREIEKKPTIKEIDNVMSTEQYVRQYFSDIPIMIQIAKCESTFRQLDSDGDIHRGRVNSSDLGVMQINEFYHGERALKHDLDLYTIEGNVAYARDLYEREGVQPWASSKPCWGKYLAKPARTTDVAGGESPKDELAINTK